jgi:hypothetical protein
VKTVQSYWPGLRFNCDSTLLLKAFSLYGPSPRDVFQTGFCFQIRAFNIRTKQETFALCKKIGGLPQHCKFFLDQPLVINAGD